MNYKNFIYNHYTSGIGYGVGRDAHCRKSASNIVPFTNKSLVQKPCCS